MREADAVFKALADPSRRQLLDALNARNGQSLWELCADLDMTRQAVTKHLDVLAEAGLVATVRRGREKLHYLNVAPINAIAERWIGRYNRQRVSALANLKQALEDKSMSTFDFVYVTYVRTTPEQLWRALTESEFTRQYWGVGVRSEWTVGSPVLVQWAAGEEFHDHGDMKVLESEPYRRLSYRWGNYRWQNAELFGWTEETFAELRKEKISKITFEIEPVGSVVKLTVTHDDFDGRTQMSESVRQGWPPILANLKTLLETGETFPLPRATAPAG
ncbi:MAG TPA: metalloregulator ArsR/SmtB family transcription factor [Actinophytocola sp.]|jgi:uncharacterized protein YndB with AHSA1/START domain/DNA-binding transcriptional ArsR family regulator|uniref:ArsR/SmtB family transcription factor n=1 Tax=Actinophytocola sp. TaxID=1872138 RepID=UPI002DFF6926|nr:metalloregulator ArsR/SmtB family transcription factor [Actinophytocola sp.]